MPHWKNWRRWLAAESSAALEDQFFETLCALSGGISIFVIIPLNYFQNLSPWVDRAILAFGLVALASAWAAHKGRYYRKTYLISVVLFLDLIWFPNGGSQGSVGMYFFVAGLFCVLFFKGGLRIAIMALLVSDVVALHVLEYAWPQIPRAFPKPIDLLLDLSSGYLIGMFVSALILWVVQNGFTKSAKALAEREAELRAVFENSQNAIGVSQHGIHEMVNPAFLSLFGYERVEDLVGTRVLDLVAPESREAVLADIRARSAGVDAPAQFESKGLRRDGTTFLLETHVSTYQRGGSLHTVVSLLDLSERARLEEVRTQYEAQARRNEKMESLGALAGGVAHDMNNVLGAVLGLASVHLEGSPQDSALHGDMETIVKACQRGGSMVRGLLGFARDSLPEERELNVNVVVREAVALLERTTLQRIHLAMDLADDIRPIQGDSAALGHALMNLCVNAVDAMPDGGTLTVRTRNDSEETILLEVLDTGSGMSKDVLDKALDPFFTTKPQGKGTGLGLPIVFGNVKAHRGKMAISSDVGRGTRVSMTFPVCKPGVEGPTAAAHPTPTPCLAALRILVVDDDELLQHAMRRLLKSLGHLATSIAGAEGALTMLANGFDPDLVILDVNMPGMDGAAALPRIRALCPSVPVLLATGRVDQSAIDLVQAHAHVSLLPKPFDLGNLRQMLESVGLRKPRLD